MNTNNELSKFYAFIDAVSPASVIATVCVMVLSCFTYINAHKDTLSPIQMICISFGVGIVVVVIIASVLTLKQRLRKERETNEQAKECLECINNYERAILSDYRLVTFDELVSRERALSERKDAAKCRVYNFTTLYDTVEGEIRSVIKRNIKRKVNYKIFYTNVAFEANQRNVDLYGNDNLIFYKGNTLQNTSSFDILLHITPEEVKGYAAVDFNIIISNHHSCAHEDDCQHDDSSIIYKALPDDISHLIESQLDIFLKGGKNDEITAGTTK